MPERNGPVATKRRGQERSIGPVQSDPEQEKPMSINRRMKNCGPVKKQQLEADVEQLIDSKLGKDYDKAVSCYPVYLTSKQSCSLFFSHSVVSNIL